MLVGYTISSLSVHVFYMDDMIAKTAVAVMPDNTHLLHTVVHWMERLAERTCECPLHACSACLYMHVCKWLTIFPDCSRSFLKKEEAIGKEG